MTGGRTLLKSATVLHLRRLILSNRCWAATLLGLALLLKALIPAGYMTVSSGKSIIVEICSGTGPASVTLHIPADGSDKGHKGTTSAEQPCAFASLGAQALAAVDPVILAAALAFTFILALRLVDLRLARHREHLRPPLRGPPALL